MVGIFCCILKEGNAAPVIHNALKRLEYRGYDSVGEATIHKDKLYIKKDQGTEDDGHIQQKSQDCRSDGRVTGALDSQARIVMCSALGQQALVQDALAAGAKDFLIKPFNPSRVIEVVVKVLNQTSNV